MPDLRGVTVQGPTVVRRQLGNRLRQLREEAGQTIKAVASAKIFSTSKMIRIEGGKIEVKAGDVWTLYRFYGVTDPDVINSLAELADGTGARGWWEDFDDQMPNPFALFLGLEQDADEILIWNPEVIPGLLQIADYTEAVVGRARPTDGLSRAIELRAARQERFFARKAPVRAVLGPATLLRPVGTPSVMNRQRQHLVKLARKRQVGLRVLPFSIGAHVGMAGAFTIFRFDAETSPSAIHFETLAGGRYMEGDAELRRYRSAFDTLWQESTPIEEYR
jgi:transcriptional regulator with XRE-family HTH domain